MKLNKNQSTKKVSEVLKNYKPSNFKNKPTKKYFLVTIPLIIIIWLFIGLGVVFFGQDVKYGFSTTMRSTNGSHIELEYNGEFNREDLLESDIVSGNNFKDESLEWFGPFSEEEAPEESIEEDPEKANDSITKKIIYYNSPPSVPVKQNGLSDSVSVALITTIGGTFNAIIIALFQMRSRRE